MNKQLEEGTLSPAAILGKFGNNGMEALQAYREKHYYEPAEIAGQGNRQPMAHDFSNFKAQQDPSGVQYLVRDELGTSKRVAFVDKGAKIEIAEGKNHAAVEAALELAAKKWNGEFTVSGTDQYKALCVKIAVERNWKLVNPELQSQIDEAKAKFAERNPQIPTVGPAYEVAQGVAPPPPQVAKYHKTDLTPPATVPTKSTKTTPAPKSQEPSQSPKHLRPPILKAKTERTR